MIEIKINPEDVKINGKWLIFEKNKTWVDRWIEAMDENLLFKQLKDLTTFFDSIVIIDGDLELC